MWKPIARQREREREKEREREREKTERGGFVISVARWKEMGKCKLRRRHFPHQRKEARSGGYDKRHHIRVGGCWSWAGSKQNTLVILPCKAWRGATRWLRTDAVGASVGIRGYGVGLEWNIVGSSQKQVESGSSVNEEMVTHIHIKKREWKDTVELDGNFCVGKRPVGKRSVDADDSDEKCDRQLECAYSQYDTGDQEGCRGGGGSMVEKIPSGWTRDTEETKPVSVKHGGETHPQMGRSCGEAPDKPLAGRSGESKSSTVLALGAAAPHRQVDRCSPEEIQNIPLGRSVVPMGQRWMHEEPLGEYWMVEGRPRPLVLASCWAVSTAQVMVFRSAVTGANADCGSKSFA